MPKPSEPPSPARLSTQVTSWFRTCARDLPWRLAAAPGLPYRRDPYRVLVSELMLQQTQVSRVIEKFNEFLAAFPTVRALGSADESQVLAMWSGLGYYRRARLLHRAAREILAAHQGQVPSDPSLLRALPGVGPYTAGAIASIAFGLPEPLVDGNVARVLLRIHGRDAAHGDPAALRWAWNIASDLVRSAAAHGADPAALNEGLMELGATVCTPAVPCCASCPVQKLCIAHAQGRQDQIPSPKKPPSRRGITADSIIVRDARGRFLVEQRPPEGMWACMWQAPTLEGPDAASPPSPPAVARWIGASSARAITLLGRFTHRTTHRDVHFAVWGARLSLPQRRAAAKGRVWVIPSDLPQLAISNPQRRILLHTAEPSAPRSARTLST